MRSYSSVAGRVPPPPSPRVRFPCRRFAFSAEAPAVTAVRSSVQHGADYYEHRWRRIGICQNASHRLVVQTAKFVFCLHNIPNRGAVQTERLGLFIKGVVPTFDQGIRDELNWDSPASAI